MVLDLDLNLISQIPLEGFLWEVVADETYLYGLRSNSVDHSILELITIPLDNLQQKPKVVLSFKAPVTSRGIVGRSLTYGDNVVMLAFPFDTHLYFLKEGKVKNQYVVNFGEQGLLEHSLPKQISANEFESQCAECNWGMVNMACLDSTLMFNSNLPYTFVVNMKTLEGDGFLNVYNNVYNFSSSQLLPIAGMKNKVAYAVRNGFVGDVLKHLKENGELGQAMREVDAIYIEDGNPLIFIWEVK